MGTWSMGRKLKASNRSWTWSTAAGIGHLFIGLSRWPKTLVCGRLHLIPNWHGLSCHKSPSPSQLPG